MSTQPKHGSELIAVVGMACRYPDAASPAALWQTVMAQRRAFRRIPEERLRSADYVSANPTDTDSTYVTEAAVLANHGFDRVRFRVTGATYRSTDPVHWLALEVAAEALEDAGLTQHLPRARTGVILGNTLTGEHTRTSTLRLRWPYVRRVVAAALAEQGWTAAALAGFLDGLEARYKAPFAPMTEDSLAGGLSNTIAGRICNHFDLGGGGYTVDGACAASLLSVITACTALDTGAMDVALAGGVDLSLDPFELVGFARAGALAHDEMRVYDQQSAGFWPGEGCGVVVLMRLEDARALGLRARAVIRGWGISSDGQGGITRPEVDGQLRAFRQAYARAGVSADSVAYFEGHGTGTRVGDAVELEALSRIRREADPNAVAAAIGSVKANIGHTKAAAGIAGLIKAAMVLQSRVLPPTTGCTRPHALLAGPAPALRVLRHAEPWPADQPLRAAVSAMGFGGINSHVVLDGPPAPAPERARAADGEIPAWSWSSAAQDAEVFLLASADRAGLAAQIDRLLGLADRISRAEMTDLAALLADQLAGESASALGGRPWRAAVVAGRPDELARRWTLLRTSLDGHAEAGVRLGVSRPGARVAFLFPGQGSPVRLSGHAWSARFGAVEALYRDAALPAGGDVQSTAVAQPAIALASLAGLRALDAVGITADVAAGHSLGELAALCWAGAIDESALIQVTTLRGRIMEEAATQGAMASISAPAPAVAALLRECVTLGEAVIAGHNGPRQTAIAGAPAAVDAVVERARAQGLPATRLPVTRAFHSPYMEPAVAAFRHALRDIPMHALARPVVSTVTGAPIEGDDLIELLAKQLATPVRFVEAADALGPVDMCVEVGPGSLLAGLVAQHPALQRAAAVSLDVAGDSVRGLLDAVAAAFVAGAGVQPRGLFADRFTRPFSLAWTPRFLKNPCEDAASVDLPAPAADQEAPAVPVTTGAAPDAPSSLLDSAGTVLDVVRRLVAERAELPVDAVAAHSRLLGDLHLSSIAVADLAATLARALKRVPPAAPTEFATATVAELATAIDALPGAEGEVAPLTRLPAGVAQWVHAFTVVAEDDPLPAPTRARDAAPAAWHVLAPPGHALASALAGALASVPGRGVAVCLPPRPEETHIELLLDGARAVLAEAAACEAGTPPLRFLLVQHDGGASAFARTLAQEAPHINVSVVDVPAGDPAAVAHVISEARTMGSYHEARYDAQGRRTRPALRYLPLAPLPGSLPLTRDDHLVVSGGGKGIGAECALALARETGVRVTLLGRAHPERDPALADNLRRFAGCDVCYLRADITDRQAVQAAMSEAVRLAGRPVTAILHAAGHNQPRRIRDLDMAAFRATLAPKVDGIGHLLDAVDPVSLRLLIAFGSVIARVGLHGEADYALANEWLTRRIEGWRAAHPQCRCLCIEWSVWSGTGMAERLGRIDALVRAGITPVPIDEGIGLLFALLRQLATHAAMPVGIIACGRLGAPSTLRWAHALLPLHRFLESPRVYVPGVELVVDTQVSFDTDHYLRDHQLAGTALLPAVVGLEAMAQAAMVLTGESGPPRFDGVHFDRPVTVPVAGHATVRVAALVRADGRVDTVLRGADTDFQVDCFRATCVFGQPPVTASCSDIAGSTEAEPVAVALDPVAELYDAVLFHGERFRRVRRYRALHAQTCAVDVDVLAAGALAATWFGPYLATGLVLGDPGARDATIHAIQACIPHRRLLPVGIERLWIGPARVTPEPVGPLRVHAIERAHDDDRFVYDVDVRDHRGQLVEQWMGLTLRAVGPLAPERAGWPHALLGPFLERAAGAGPGTGSITVAVERGPDRERRRARALHRLGVESSYRRPDGKREPAGATGAVSISHTADLTLAIAAPVPGVGCDIEVATHRACWPDILGGARMALAERISAQRSEALDVAATRLWSAGEALEKAGLPPGAPLVLVATDGAWVHLRSGPCAIATLATTVRDIQAPVVIALASRPGSPFFVHTSQNPSTGDESCAPTNIVM
jgi:enediyne polyketide synthase